MLRRINRLRHVGRFTDLQSASGNQGEFAKFNVIYAQNASGKTTLCDVFRSLSTGNSEYVEGRKRFGSETAVEIEVLLHGTPTPKAVLTDGTWRSDPAGTSAPRIMIYDDRFVADHVLVGQHVAVEQRRNLFGLVIGEQGIALKQRIDTAERELNRATNALNIAKAALSSLIPMGWSIDSFRSVAKDDGIAQRIQDANNQLDVEKRHRQIVDAIRQRKLLQIANLPVMPLGLSEVLAKALADVALKAWMLIQEHLKQHSRDLSVEWVGQGRKAQIGTNCPYCGQEMEGLEIFRVYRAFFSGEFQIHRSAQQDVLNKVKERFGPEARQRLQQVLTSHVVEREWWRDAGGYSFNLPTCPSADAILASMEAVEAAIVGAVQRKVAEPTLSTTLTDAEQTAVNVWTQISTTLTAYMDGLASTNKAISERQRTAGTVDVTAIERRIGQLNAQKRRHETDVIDAYSKFDEATTAKAAREREKAAANAALRQQSAMVMREYGDCINAFLSKFRADFRIVDAAVSFFGGPPSGDLAIEILGTRVSTTPEDARNPSKPSLANTLSGGDRSALGLAFFLAVVERDANLGSSIVVFDDPFHRQDRSRRRRTVECIHQAANRSKQCFVLSHDLDFAREAARIVGAHARTFSMDPMANHTILKPDDLPPLAGDAYRQDYLKLSAYVRDPAQYATQRKEVARCIRPTLEGYLRIKFPEAWTEKDWLGDMIAKIRASQPDDNLRLASHLVDELTELNEYSKRFSHSEVDGGDAADVDPQELMSYVKQTLYVISK